jgi:hypothetical protein
VQLTPQCVQPKSRQVHRVDHQGVVQYRQNILQLLPALAALGSGRES